MPHVGGISGPRKKLHSGVLHKGPASRAGGDSDSATSSSEASSEEYLPDAGEGSARVDGPNGRSRHSRGAVDAYDSWGWGEGQEVECLAGWPGSGITERESTPSIPGLPKEDSSSNESEEESDHVPYALLDDESDGVGSPLASHQRCALQAELVGTDAGVEVIVNKHKPTVLRMPEVKVICLARFAQCRR